MTAAVDQALAAAQDDLRIADRHADAGDESAVVPDDPWWEARVVHAKIYPVEDRTA
ncbi:hypothetical protein [Kitasatospora sp. NPDC088351]|uniref:hypothetical protein n=1 Tax=Kitasatospora sp. NPDC088351 TaxID=3155180 RepID=UPI003427B284